MQLQHTALITGRAARLTEPARALRPPTPGLPPFTAKLWAPIPDVGGMMGLALVVMVVDLLESTSIAR